MSSELQNLINFYVWRDMPQASKRVARRAQGQTVVAASLPQQRRMAMRLYLSIAMRLSTHGSTHPLHAITPKRQKKTGIQRTTWSRCLIPMWDGWGKGCYRDKTRAWPQTQIKNLLPSTTIYLSKFVSLYFKKNLNINL